MRLKLIHEDVNILPWSDDYGLDGGDAYDPWVAADQAEKVASDSGVRIDSTKELSYIALSGDLVVGGLWTALEQDEMGWVYSWDVAVDPKFRNARVGIELIDAAMADFDMHQSEYDNVRMRVWAINPKLVRVLERKYGFDVEQGFKDGSAMMVRESYEGLPDNDQFFGDNPIFDCDICSRPNVSAEMVWCPGVFGSYNCTRGICDYCRRDQNLMRSAGWYKGVYGHLHCAEHAPGARPVTRLDESYEGLPDTDEFTDNYECVACGQETASSCPDCNESCCPMCQVIYARGKRQCPNCRRTELDKQGVKIYEGYDGLPDDDTFSRTHDGECLGCGEMVCDNCNLCVHCGHCTCSVGYTGLPDEDEFEPEEPTCGRCQERPGFTACDECYIEICDTCGVPQLPDDDPLQQTYLCVECDHKARFNQTTRPTW